MLPKYAEILRLLRGLSPPEATLSITGLPTWAVSNDIYAVLEAVDFWISMIRKLEKPFYVGLSAYSYAILYGKDGDLIELRGDIDPEQAAQNADLYLARTERFRGKNGDMRYEYQARNDTVLDGLVIRAGERLVFDLPTAATKRLVSSEISTRQLGLERLPESDSRVEKIIDQQDHS